MSVENPATVIIDTISTDKLIGKNQTINVAWHLSDPLLKVNGYVLSIMSDGKSLHNFVSETTSGSFPIPNDLLKTGNVYNLQIWYQNVDGRYGPGSDPVQLVLEAPLITAANGADKSVSAVYSVPAIYDGYKNCRFKLEDSEKETVIGTSSATESPAIMTTAVPLSPTPGTYKVYGKIVFSSKSKGPVSDKIEAHILDKPHIISSKYDENSITVTYSYVNSTASQVYRINVYENQINIQTVQVTGLLTKTFRVNFAPDQTKQYTVTVQALIGDFSGPESLPADIFTVAPIIRLATNNQQKNITGKVDYPSGAIHGDSVLLSLFVDDKVVQNAPITPGSEACLKYTGSFRGTSSYSIRMSTVKGISIGALSEKVSVIWQVNSFSNLTYDGKVFRGTVNFNQDPGSGTSAKIAFNKNGSLQDTFTVAPAQGAISAKFTYTPKIAMTANDLYSFTVFSIDAVSVGPESSPVNVYQEIPSIKMIAYDGSGITVSWDKAPNTVSATAIDIALYKDTQLVENVDGKGVAHTFKPAVKLLDTFQYEITIAYKNLVSKGQESLPQSVVTQLATTKTVDYDGTTITAPFKYPVKSTTGEYGYLMSLYESGTLIQNHQGTGETATLTPSAVLLKNNYTIKIAMVRERSIGPYNTAVTVYTLPLVISSIDYRDSQISVSVSNLPKGVFTYTIALYKNGRLFQTEEGKSPTTRFTPSNPLTSNNNYQIACAIHVGISTGPYGNKESITVLSAPFIERAIYNGTDLMVGWKLAEGVSTNSFLSSIFEGTSVILNKQGSGLSTNFSNLSEKLSGDNRFSVKVASTNSNQVGEYSIPALIIYQIPAIASATYNDNKLCVSWTLPDTSYTGTGYQLDLFENSIKKETFNGSGTSLSVTPKTVFTNGKKYTVCLSSVNGIAVGPRSDLSEVIALDVPVLTSLSFDTTYVTLSFTYSGITTPTEYNITVYKDGEVYFSVSTTDKNKTFTPPEILSAHETYTLKVAAKYNGVTGKESAASLLIAGSPSITSTHYSFTTVSAAWNLPNENVGDGYKASVFDSKGTTEVSYSGNGSDTQFPVESFTGIPPYNIKVMSTNGISSGPLSSPETLVTFQPLNPMLYLADSKLTASFTVLGDTFVYKAMLFENEVKIEDQNVHTSPVVFTSEILPGSIYTFNVEAVLGISNGPLSETVYGPFSANCRYTFDDLSRLTAVDSHQYVKRIFTVDANGNITRADIQAPTKA